MLDTNVALDWLLFADPATTALAAMLEQGRLRWIASPAMRDEFEHVLERGLAVRRQAQPADLLARWDRRVTLVPTPPPLPGSVPLRCTDPDDQVFLELAHAGQARWLLSRDRALLCLARSAAAFGIGIITPERWSPAHD